MTFRRQPENPYDANATQVLNTFEQQVGHLPRRVVLHLAPHLDSKALALEAVVPRGSKNKYKIPLKLFVYAANDKVAGVRSSVAAAGLSLTMSDPQAERILEVRVPRIGAGTHTCSARELFVCRHQEERHTSLHQQAQWSCLASIFAGQQFCTHVAGLF